MSNAILNEIVKSAPSKIVDLYEADFNPINPNPDVSPDNKLRFFSDVSELGAEIVWNGQTYSSYPCEIDGIEWSGSGQLPSPKIRFANINGTFRQLNVTYQDMLGVKITRFRTMLKYLDAVNFEGGINVDADPTAVLSTDIFYVDRKALEDNSIVEYELVSVLDLRNVRIPRRIVLQNLCPWKYKDSNTCDYQYSGSPIYYDIDGNVTALQANDVCGKRLSDCKLRFNQTTGILNFGGFPGAGMVK